jgi:hypothetical protein
MRILLGISLLVLVATLWTMISIVRHIRITRRRNLFLREQQEEQQLQITPPLRSVAHVTPLPARFAAPVFPAAPRVPSAAELSYTELATATAHATMPESATHASLPVSSGIMASTPVANAIEMQSPQTNTIKPTAAPAGIASSRHAVAASEKVSTTNPLGLIAAAHKFSHDLPMPQMRSSETIKIVEAPAEEHVLRILEFVPDSVNSDVFPAAPAFPSLGHAQQPNRVLRQMPMATTTSDPHVRRPVRSVQSPAAAFTLPKHRPDWAYFNKDMGDLSDPLPRRVRDRVRSR